MVYNLSISISINPITIIISYLVNFYLLSTYVGDDWLKNSSSTIVLSMKEENTFLYFILFVKKLYWPYSYAHPTATQMLMDKQI